MQLETPMQTPFRIGWHRAHRWEWTEGQKPLEFSRLRTNPGASQVHAREPRRCAQRIRKVSCSSDCCGYRQRHARASLPERSRRLVGAHCQGVARKAQIAPCRVYEAFQGKRTGGSARAPDPASAARRCGRLGGVIFRGCLLGLHVRSRRFLRKCHVRLFRRIVSRTGAPRRTQELFGRGSAFSFWIRPNHCGHVPCGVWFERCNTHMVQGRGCSWKGCASNAGGRPLVRPCSGPNQHIHRRPIPQLAWHAKAARQAASSRVTLSDRSRVQSCLGQRDDVQSGQVHRFRDRTRFSKPYGHCPNPSQNCRCVQAGCTRTVKRTDVAFEEAPPARGKRRLDHESPSQSKVDNPEVLESHRRRRTAMQLHKSRQGTKARSRWSQGLSFSRVFGETRPLAEFELVFHASP